MVWYDGLCEHNTISVTQLVLIHVHVVYPLMFVLSSSTCSNDVISSIIMVCILHEYTCTWVYHTNINTIIVIVMPTVIVFLFMSAIWKLSWNVLLFYLNCIQWYMITQDSYINYRVCVWYIDTGVVSSLFWSCHCTYSHTHHVHSVRCITQSCTYTCTDMCVHVLYY